MARPKKPTYGFVASRGEYRKRIKGPDGRRISLYAKTPEELTEKIAAVQREIEEDVYHRDNPTVEEYATKWLAMHGSHVRTTTLVDYTSKVKIYIIEPLGKKYMAEVTPDDVKMAINKAAQQSALPKKVKSEKGIVVEGLSNCLVKFAKCCTPVPGDPVIGFITRGYGVSVHRCDCPNANPERRKPEEADRWVKVSWVENKLPNYKTSLELSAKDRDNLTLDVAMALSTAKVKVSALSARSMPDGHATISMVVEVKDKSELEGVINKLNNIQGVYHVARASGK